MAVRRAFIGIRLRWLLRMSEGIWSTSITEYVVGRPVRKEFAHIVRECEKLGIAIVEGKNRFNRHVMLDANFNPVSGGMLRFFEPYPKVGVAVQTFADPECQIPNTHPIIASQDGEFPPVYLKTSGPFRAVFSDAYDEIIADYSQIFPLVE